MKHITKFILASILASASPLFTQAKQWSLQDCISYAIKNNITIQKAQLTKKSAYEDYLQSKAALLPSLSASTSQSINYTPWVASGISSDGYTRSSIDKTSYNGMYSVSGNWTIWNGNRNRNQIKLNKLTVEAAELDSAIQAQNIEEQIVQLYIQILYSNEAIEVNKERGKTMLNVGKISKADLAQLTAQRAQDEYNIVSAENNVKNYKRQLKALLQITNEDDFDITIPTTTDEMAMTEIPALNDVYNSALNNRPEIKNYLNHIKQSDLNIKIAKANKLPTISANAGISTSTTSMNNNSWRTQLKDNFGIGGGISVSIPISDNRNSKTIINKALIQKENCMLDLKNQQTTLYSTIENYWLQANTSQTQFKAAKLNTESAQKSYELLNEQFNLGLKNIIELRTGKDKYIMAKQNELQAKYMTILNHDMLKFYQNGIIK